MQKIITNITIIIIIKQIIVKIQKLKLLWPGDDRI